jgi:hypothetical protein
MGGLCGGGLGVWRKKGPRLVRELEGGRPLALTDAAPVEVGNGGVRLMSRLENNRSLPSPPAFLLFLPSSSTSSNPHPPVNHTSKPKS